jgi:hypothetical protein
LNFFLRFKEYTLIVRKTASLPPPPDRLFHPFKPIHSFPPKRKHPIASPPFPEIPTYIHIKRTYVQKKGRFVPSNPIQSIHAIEQDDSPTPPKRKENPISRVQQDLLEPLLLLTPPSPPSCSQDRPSSFHSRQRHLCSNCLATPSARSRSRLGTKRSGRCRGWLRGQSRRLRLRL